MTGKKIVSVFLCAVIAFSCAACSPAVTTNVDLMVAQDDLNKNAEIIEPAEVTKLADNGTQFMEYDPVETRVNIRDPVTSELLWSTGATEEEYQQTIANKFPLQFL